MRIIVTTTVSVLLLFTTIAYTACNKDPYTYEDECAGVVCENNGTCIDGTCACVAGYYGDNCEKKAISRYLGTWAVEQTVVTSTDTSKVNSKEDYNIVISEHPDGPNVLAIKGMFGVASSELKGRLGTAIGVVEIDGATKEGDVPSDISNFVFNRYQPVGNATQLIKGEGQINNIGEKITGEVYITYADSAFGAVEERIIFKADYVN